MRIGYATSANGINWSKYSDNPVLQRGSVGTWDEKNVTNPVVIRSDSLYQMWYVGRGRDDVWQTGYATSLDGINWEKHPNNPVLTAGEAGEWDHYGAVARSVLFEGGKYYLWYQGRIQSGAFLNIDVGLATSTDGINWTKHPANPVFKRGKSNSWDSDAVWFPRVIKDGHRYRMWYSGRRSNVDRLGYAEDFSNAAHTDSIRVDSKTVAAGADTVRFEACIANPHSESLSARALVNSNDGSVSESVDLADIGNGVWQGEWQVPVDAHVYSVGVELNNQSAGYVHNSFDWGVFDEFNSIVTSVNEEAQNNIPAQFALHKNYPNPFNPSTTIAFSLPQSSFVTLKVYNLLGKEVAIVLQEHKPAGRHTVSFDASNLASGLYYYTLTAGEFKQSRKMLLLR